MMWTEEKLNELLTTPSDKLVNDIAKIKGDIMVLGAGGKMGPTLCILAKNAIKKAIEEIFKVEVEKVTTMNYIGKPKRQGVFSGKRADWKKAVVKLKEGSKTIELFES